VRPGVPDLRMRQGAEENDLKRDVDDRADHDRPEDRTRDVPLRPRTLARELVGLVPGGVGMGLKAMVAYAGTFAAGRAAVFYYQVGRPPTPIERRGMHREGTRRARTAVREAIETLRRGD